MTIVRLRAEHAPQLAALHCEHLTGLLHALGPASAEAFYRGASKAPTAVGYVALDGTTVQGFVVGAMRQDWLQSQAAARSPWRTSYGLVRALLRKPSVLRWLLRRPRASKPTDAAELTYIVVAPSTRGTGLGRALIEAFESEALRRGARAVELSVDAGNTGAMAVYGRLGYDPIGVYDEFDITHHRYRHELR